MGDRYSTGLFWVLELFMVPPGSDLVPTILLEFFYDFPAVHVYNVYTPVCWVKKNIRCIYKKGRFVALLFQA